MTIGEAKTYWLAHRVEDLRKSHLERMDDQIRDAIRQGRKRCSVWPNDPQLLDAIADHYRNGGFSVRVVPPFSDPRPGESHPGFVDVYGWAE